MDIMDIMDQISELKNTVCSLKAVAGAFSNRYTEGSAENNILAVKANPDDYSYLFYTITGLICEAKNKINDLEALAEQIHEEGGDNQ